jgi:hypothetical protein
MSRADVSDLPTPITASDEIALAIVAELRGLRSDLASARGGAPAPEGEVRLREPAPPPSTTRKPKTSG